MTEVQTSEETGASLLATKDYAIGDTILQEDVPLIKLAPASTEEEQQLFSALRKPPSSKNGKPKDDKQSFWDSIVVPSEIPEHCHGKFKGMVQAALCYVNSDTSSDTKSRFFQLYYPSAQELSNKEKEIEEVANHALKYLKDHNQVDDKQKELLHDEETMRKVMLIWSCNAFDGGRVYDRISRINHCCDPNAIVQKGAQEDEQIVKAGAPIAAGDEITISYLGMLLYADRATRQDALLQTKHFVCQCQRCKTDPDKACMIPCPSRHCRIAGQRQLDEDVQYDDEQTVRYAWPKDPTGETIECQSCHTSFSSQDKEFKILFNAAKQVTEKVAIFLRDYECARTSDDDEDDDDTVQQELREQHLHIASSVLGARHWATNLMLLLELDQKLQGFHGDLLSEGKDPDLESIAEIIDMLERVCRFVDGLEIKQHRGHLLSDVIVGVARALVSLGDAKSQKYAAEWLEKLDGYVDKFEAEGMQKVCSALKVAWARNDDGTSEPPKKRGKTS